MILVQEARELVFNEAFDTFAGKQRKFQKSTGPVTHFRANEPIQADRDFPPFSRVLMDGIALRFADFDQGSRVFSVQSVQAAGQPPARLERTGFCVEIMTGAVLPVGADTVVRYEDLERLDGAFAIRKDIEVKKLQNIQVQGSECPKGKILIEKGTALLAPHWAVLASVGIEIPRSQDLLLPKVAIVATGDELVPVGAKPNDFQIRVSNPTTLEMALLRHGFVTSKSELVGDDAGKFEQFMQDIVLNYDVCILSGAVSAGKFDFVPSSLRNLGVEERFHKVAQKPGKPFWFGKSKSGCLVFALPGNPVSALVNTYVYVLEALKILNGKRSKSEERHLPFARLTEPLSFSMGESMTLFAPVEVDYGRCGTTFARPLQNALSSHVAKLTESHGFIECAPGSSLFEKGQSFPLTLW
jgi:molybdopterin molybdotransferase